MKRSDVVKKVLDIISEGQPATGHNAVYCDHSVSNETLNRYFLRIKYPCYSQNVKRNFESYKSRIEEYLMRLGENSAVVKLNETGWPGYHNYYYIEIVFMDGKIWDKFNQRMKKQKQSIVESTIALEKIMDDNLNDKLNMLADFIRKDLKENISEYLKNSTVDELINIYKIITKK